MPTPEKLILLGLAGPGPHSHKAAAAHLARHYGFYVYDLGAPLEEMLLALLDQAGADPAYLSEPALQARPIPGIDASYRDLAKTLDTAWAREHFGADFWLHIATRALGLGPRQSPIHDRIVITGLQYANEARYVTHSGGRVVALCSPGTEAQAPAHWGVDHLQIKLQHLAELPQRLHELAEQIGLEPRPPLWPEEAAEDAEDTEGALPEEAA